MCSEAELSRGAKRTLLAVIAAALLLLCSWAVLMTTIRHPEFVDGASFPFLPWSAVVLAIASLIGAWRPRTQLQVAVLVSGWSLVALWQMFLFPLWISRVLSSQSTTHLYLAAISLVPVLVALWAGQRLLRLSRQNLGPDIAERRGTMILAGAAFLSLSGVLIAAVWLWQTSPRPGNSFAHLALPWRLGPFLGAWLILIASGLVVMRSKRPALASAGGALGLGILGAESLCALGVIHTGPVLLAGLAAGFLGSVLLLRGPRMALTPTGAIRSGSAGTAQEGSQAGPTRRGLPGRAPTSERDG